MGKIIKMEDYLKTNGSETSGTINNGNENITKVIKINNGCNNNGNENNGNETNGSENNESNNSVNENMERFNNNCFKGFLIIMFVLNLITVASMIIYDVKTPGIYQFFCVTLVLIGLFTSFICWKLR